MAWVQPAGELDVATAGRLDARLEELHGGDDELVLDLRGVTFLDCAGLRTVLRWGDVLLGVVPGRPSVQRLFALTATAADVPFLRAPSAWPAAAVAADDRLGD